MVHMITKRHFSDVIMVLFLNGYKCQFGLILFSYYKVVFFCLSLSLTGAILHFPKKSGLLEAKLERLSNFLQLSKY